MLDDDNRQSEQLRGALVITREKLEIETHRADNAELRAETAEAKLRQSEARATNAERARRTLEIEDARTREEIKRLRQQLDNAHREIRRAQSFIDELAEARNKAELAAHKNRETARGYQLALREREMLEQGREEGRRLGMQKGYREGRLRGWEEGREEGWEEGLEEGREGSAEGVVKGRVDGWRAGLDRGQSIGKAQVWKAGQRDGREEERRQAVDAFDKYMDNEPVGPQLGDSDEQSPERNARNVSAVHRIQTHAPIVLIDWCSTLAGYTILSQKLLSRTRRAHRAVRRSHYGSRVLLTAVQCLRTKSIRRIR